MKICETFPPCVEDPLKCGYAINCSSFGDYNENGEPTRFVGGIDCPYGKWKKIDRVKEIGHTDEPIEISEFPIYKPNCNLSTCRYNTDGKCENEEKRKECVEVATKVLCLFVNDNDDFCGKIEKTGQVVRGKVEVHHCVGIQDKRTFDVFGKPKDFSGISKMTLSTGEILEVYKAYGSNRLIEV